MKEIFRTGSTCRFYHNDGAGLKTRKTSSCEDPGLSGSSSSVADGYATDKKIKIHVKCILRLNKLQSSYLKRELLERQLDK